MAAGKKPVRRGRIRCNLLKTWYRSDQDILSAFKGQALSSSRVIHTIALVMHRTDFLKSPTFFLFFF